MSERNQVLKQRTITGIVFGLIVLMMIFSGKIGAIALMLIIALGGSHEYVRMVFTKNKRKLSFTIFVVLGIMISIFSMGVETPVFDYLVTLACMFLLLGIMNLYRPFINHKRVYWLVAALYLALPLGLFITYIYYAPTYPRPLLLSIIGLIWMSDSLAYLVGSRIGKNKLAPTISPKKTWEGFIGGGIFTLALVFIIQMYQSTYPTWFWLSVALVVWVIGTYGDLVESSIKRAFDIKDSGKLLPGHGGILDRFDSFIYVLPFVLLLQLFSQKMF